MDLHNAQVRLNNLRSQIKSLEHSNKAIEAKGFDPNNALRTANYETNRANIAFKRSEIAQILRDYPDLS